jgi:transcription elongation factor Elf1
MVAVRLQPKEETTIISCGSCGTSQEISSRGKEPIDIYNEFVDRFNSGQTATVTTTSPGVAATETASGVEA